jgi:hypothetical protein
MRAKFRCGPKMDARIWNLIKVVDNV